MQHGSVCAPVSRGKVSVARSFVAEVIKSDPRGARFCVPFVIGAKNFVAIARPGDVFEYQDIEYVVESVCAEPLVIHAILGGIAKATLMPAAKDDIAWKVVAE